MCVFQEKLALYVCMFQEKLEMKFPRVVIKSLLTREQKYFQFSLDRVT